MTDRPFRVLLVEDSPTTREYLVSLLDDDPALHVVGQAPDGEEAVRLAARLRPDVVLMDVHMPRVDGYEATRRIMETVPTPVVIVSASFELDDAAAALEALKAGAVAIVVKPPAPGQPGHTEGARTLIEQVRLMAEVKVVRRRPPRAQPAPPKPQPVPGRRIRVIAIGASTGGPQALAEILALLPAGLACPVLIVQHIAPGFVPGLAKVLGEDTRLRVKPAEAGEIAHPGSVYLAPDGHQMGLSAIGRIALTQDTAQNGFRPSASYLFASVARDFGGSALGILLTGMSGDGADGLKRLHDAGGLTIVQDEETSVIFGMPKEAIRLGAADYVLPPARIAATIDSLVRHGREVA
jgi:two-component system chemotaxis response regulator CheB